MPEPFWPAPLPPALAPPARGPSPGGCWRTSSSSPRSTMPSRRQVGWGGCEARQQAACGNCKWRRAEPQRQPRSCNAKATQRGRAANACSHPLTFVPGLGAGDHSQLVGARGPRASQYQTTARSMCHVDSARRAPMPSRPFLLRQMPPAPRPGVISSRVAEAEATETAINAAREVCARCCMHGHLCLLISTPLRCFPTRPCAQQQRGHVITHHPASFLCRQGRQPLKVTPPLT